jgi:PTH1 family peptidyl-tRNA hydrolase
VSGEVHRHTRTGQGNGLKIVVGLGNPGQRYAETRHNIGWMVLDRLADRAGVSGRARARDAAATATARYDGLELLLVKPTTFMNESGIAVRKVLARERTPLEEMLVVIDDFALPFGRLRMREGGSAGSHNGLRSIIGELGTDSFARLRVGIGEPLRDRARDHVLSRFSPSEREALDELLEAAADAVEDWARADVSTAANRWNPWLPSWLLQAGGGGALGGDSAIRSRSKPEASSEAPAEGAVVPSSDTGGPPAEGAAGPPGAREEGIRRTSTGWRKLLRLPDDRGEGRR